MVIAKSALEGNALCVEAAVDYLLQLKSLGIGGIFSRLTIFPRPSVLVEPVTVIY